MIPPWLRKNWGWAAVLALAAVTAVALRMEGRVWFCACQQIRVWIADAYSSHTSQHLADPYTLSHVQHGLVLFWALAWLVPRWSWHARLAASTLIEVAWEIIENSEFVINRYRETTAALGYEGDSVLNSVGDVLACAAGFAIAGRIGWRATAALFAAVEIGMVLWIRDSLLLNVLMLFYPLEAVKQWQTT